MSLGDFELPEIVPIFPLPGVVLFPRAAVHLHIFELRYRVMTRDALAGDHCLAVALLKPGHEALYRTRNAPIHSLVCVGRILAAEPLSDGRFNLLLRGEARAIIREEVGEKPYRLGRIDPVPAEIELDVPDSARLRADLRSAIEESVFYDVRLRRSLLSAFELPLGTAELVDVLASGAPTEPELRQVLLAERDVAKRARLLTEQLETMAAVMRQRGQIDRSGPSATN